VLFVLAFPLWPSKIVHWNPPSWTWSHFMWHYTLLSNLSFILTSQSGDLPINISLSPSNISSTWNSNSPKAPSWPKCFNFKIFDVVVSTPLIYYRLTKICASPTLISILFFKVALPASIFWNTPKPTLKSCIK